MDRDMAQLADILVDWCEADLWGGNFVGQSPTWVAQSVVKTLAFTLVNDPTARELLARIVQDGKEELELRYREDEDR